MHILLPVDLCACKDDKTYNCLAVAESVFKNAAIMRDRAIRILCLLGFCVSSAQVWQSDQNDGTFLNPDNPGIRLHLRKADDNNGHRMNEESGEK